MFITNFTIKYNRPLRKIKLSSIGMKIFFKEIQD